MLHLRPVGNITNVSVVFQKKERKKENSCFFSRTFRQMKIVMTKLLITFDFRFIVMNDQIKNEIFLFDFHSHIISSKASP